jgi:hypothetical protein
VVGAAAWYALGQDTGPSATDLARQTQNPVSSLTSIPLQFNFFSGGPLKDRTLYNLNIQPVFPLPLTSEVNLIARTIVPYESIPGSGPTDRVKGIGDIEEQLFFTPKNSGAVIIGAGPLFSFPTATNDLVKSGDWAAGPAVVIVMMPGHWVLGGLVTQLWTFAPDDTGPHINQMVIQPAVNYNLAEGWSLAFSPIITANWSAPPGEKWTVPLGAGVSKVTSIGRQPVSLTLAYYNNVTKPSNVGKSELRLAISFLFPIPPAPK